MKNFKKKRKKYKEIAEYRLYRNKYLNFVLLDPKENEECYIHVSLGGRRIYRNNVQTQKQNEFLDILRDIIDFSSAFIFCKKHAEKCGFKFIANRRKIPIQQIWKGNY